MSFFLSLLQLAVPLIGWLLNKVNADTETKKRFFEWVELASKDTGSVKLREYAQAQLEWFKNNPFVETP